MYIVFILVDALRADHFPGGAASHVQTPAVTKLAREGVTFANAISQASSTRPSVPSIMTGVYPSQHGLADRWQLKDGELSVVTLDPSLGTLAEHMASAGYATAAFMAGNANLKPLFGLMRGFETPVWRPTKDGEPIVQDFAAWLQADRADQALVYFHFMDVHNPLPDEIIPSRLKGGLDVERAEDNMRTLADHYAAAAQRVDGHIGNIVECLRAAGLYEDSWIIITADHGEEMLEHGRMLAHGRTLYRELVHVPLIMKLPAQECAGTVITQPVQLIDLLPTVLDSLSLPQPRTPGESLLPLIRGAAPERRYAYSEVLRQDRYLQSVTTDTHQFIQLYMLKDVPTLSAADLQPGQCVEIKGQAVRGGDFLATKVSLEQRPALKVRGTVQSIEPGGSSLSVMGLTFVVDRDTILVDMDKQPFALTELTPGDKVSVSFDVIGEKESLLAKRVKRRKRGGKSKVQATIEDVQDLDGGGRRISLLGMQITITADVPVSAPGDRGKEKPSKTNALLRVLTGDYFEVQRELYDITVDAPESRNIVDERPDIAQELEARLAEWSQSLAGAICAPASAVDVDPETLAQLRAMGYVD